MGKMRKTTSGGFDLVQGILAKPPTNIPNAIGEVYKRELTILRALNLQAFKELLGDDGSLTIKVNVWSLPDVDRFFGDGASPHNHPWPFKSMIISGSYTEDRYRLVDNVIERETKTYQAGDINEMPADTFHLVTEVIPGTITVMVCGTPAPGNEWGYLDLTTKQYSPAKMDPNFLDKLKEVNPHLR